MDFTDLLGADDGALDDEFDKQGQYIGPEKQLHGDPDAAGGWDDNFAFGLNESEEQEIKDQKDAVIFLIDCHRTMQMHNPHNGPDQQSNIEQILRAALNFAKTKIITNENDKVGIVLWGCHQNGGAVPNQNSLNFRSVHVLYQLDLPDATLIKELEAKLITFTQDHGWYQTVAPTSKEGASFGNQMSSSQNLTSSLITDGVGASLPQGTIGSSLQQQRGLQGMPGTASQGSGSQGNSQGRKGTLKESSVVGQSLQKSQPSLNAAPQMQSSSAASGRSPLFEALWTCHHEFKQVEKQQYSKRIFIFTDCDSPGSLQDQAMALQRAQDLESLHVDLELFPMANGEQMRPQFDVRRYYANLISFEDEEMVAMGGVQGMLDVEAAHLRIQELMKRIRQKEYRKKIQGKCMFEITKGCKIGLNFFTMIMQARKPAAKQVNAENNQLLQPTVRIRCKESDHVLYRNQIGTFYPLGGEKVRMTRKDMQQIKNFAEGGMQLLGFKDRRYLKVYHNIRHSYFIFPDEKKATGSSQCTDALIKEMIKKDKIAIVRFAPRVNAQVRLCALVPQEEQADGDGEGQGNPAGFQMVALPYADDLRDDKQLLEHAGFMEKGQFGQAQEVKEGIVDTLTKQEKDAAKLLVKNLDIDFDCKNFENPSIQKFFSGLQALALNEAEPEEVEDLLEPNLEELKRFETIMDRFRGTFFDGQRQDPTSDFNKPSSTAKDKKKLVNFESSQSSPKANNRKRKEAPGGSRARVQSKPRIDEADEEIPPSQSFNSRGMAGNMPYKRRKMDLVDYDDDSDQGKKRPRKQKLDKNGAADAAKDKENQSTNSPPLDLEQLVIEANNEGKLSKVKVADLQAFLEQKGLPSKGKKQLLQDLVKQCLDE